MTDRELLELAAKAADIGGRWGDQIDYHNGSVDLTDYWVLDGDDLVFWNPLTDDGDALRLAMKLGICIQFIPQCDTVQVYQEREFTAEPFNVHVAGLGDIETRRCIVQAASEIGKSMEKSQCDSCKGWGHIEQADSGATCATCNGTGKEVQK